MPTHSKMPAEDLSHSMPSGPLKIPPTPKKTDLNIRLSIAIPTYNERDNIAKLVDGLTKILDLSLKDAYELILVDDNSPDRTWELAQDLSARYPSLRVIRREDERDLASAVIRGWQMARGNILGVIDADLQHPPEVLTQLWQEINQKADLAVASRHIQGGGAADWYLSRRILSRGAQLLGMIMLPSVVARVSDPMSGYFLVRRSAIANIPLNPTGYKILIEVLGRGKIRSIAEVGYVFRERNAAKSKVGWRLFIKYVVHLARLRLAVSARK